MKQRTRWTSMLLGMLILFMMMLPIGLSSAAKAVTPAEGSVDNEYYRLTVSETDGRFSLFNKRTGKQLHSYPDGLDEDETLKNAGRIRVRSALQITLLDTATNAEALLYSESDAVSAGGLSLTVKENEYIVTYHFIANDVTIPVHYTLQGERLVVSVYPEEIEENGTSLLMDIAIHPYFYSGTTKDNGFLFVPDGSGSLIQFNNKKYSVLPYKQKVYGRDLSLYQVSNVEHTQPVLMPMFGIGKEDGIALGVITGGAGDAYVEASPGIGTVTYNCAYASFKLLPKDMKAYPQDNRTDVDVYPKSRNGADLLQVSYSFREGDKLTYTDLASLYREYLIETYQLKRMQDNAYPLYLDLYMSTMRKKSFLGVTYQGIEVLTTFQQAGALVEELQARNIPTVVRLNNWSRQTAKGQILSGASMLGAVGSKSELRALQTATEKNGALYLNGNISEVYGGGVFSKLLTYAKNMRKATLQYQEFNLATNFSTDEVHYLLSLKNIEKYTAAFGQKVSRLGVSTIGIEGLNNMFTDYSQEKASLSETVKTYQTALSSLKEQGLSVSVTGGNEFTLGSTSLIWNMPSGDSLFEVCDESVPFYAIVLHGYVPFTMEAINASSNPEIAYLKTLETGSGLYFQWIYAEAEKARYSRNSDLYRGQADAWMDSALSHYADYAAFMQDKQSQPIIGHEKLADNVYRTTFEDGSYVAVNYSDRLYEGNGLRVEAVSYTFGKDVSR